MEEEQKIHEQEQQPQKPQQPTPKPKKAGLVSRVLGGDVLQSKGVTKQIPLIMLCCFYALMLVYNRYQVEDLTKEKLAAQERISSLRERRIQLQKRFQETIKISQIADRLDSTGVGFTAGPPYEI